MVLAVASARSKELSLTSKLSFQFKAAMRFGCCRKADSASPRARTGSPQPEAIDARTSVGPVACRADEPISRTLARALSFHAVRSFGDVCGLLAKAHCTL